MKQPTALIVDDEPHIRYMLEFKLREAGYRVLTASSGNRAYELACEHRPQVVVTDHQMPGCDGLELSRMLAANADTKSIPVLMLTARGRRLDQDDLAKTSIRALVAKPFSPSELIIHINSLLSGEGEPPAPEAESGSGPTSGPRLRAAS